MSEPCDCKYISLKGQQFKVIHAVSCEKSEISKQINRIGFAFEGNLESIFEAQLRDELRIAEIDKLESQNKKLIEALRFYANNVASVWDCNGENLLEECSETARAVLKEVGANP